MTSRKPALLADRITGAIVLIGVLIIFANEYFGWRLFGPYSRLAETVWGIVAIALLRYKPSARGDP